MSDTVKFMPRTVQQSRFPFTSTEISSVSSSGPIITVDMSSSNSSETTQSPMTPLDEDNSLNTATLHQSVPDSPAPLTYTTAKSLLTSVSMSIAPQPLATESLSVMKQSGRIMTGPAIGFPHFYFPKMAAVGVISPVNLQSSFELGLRLKQTLDSCQSSETEAGMEERWKIVEELDSLVKHWVRNKVSKQGMRKNYIERAGGKVVTYGSFKLGVVDKDSDLDLLAVVPRFVNREEFFDDFYGNLARRSCDVTELRSLSTAFVPVIKFKYRGIDVDLTLARLTTDYVREDEDFLDQPFISRDLDPRCLRSLNGYRATKELLQLVPSVERFQLVLRLVKMWARTQGIYGNILGYLGGASWAILVAKACQIEADMQGCQLPVSHLVFLFFKVKFAYGRNLKYF